MSRLDPEDPSNRENEFARQAEAGQRGMLGEMIDFLRHDKRWWLAPILIVLVLVAVLLVLGGTSVAPFIYTLF